MTWTANAIMPVDQQTLPFARHLREAVGLYARRTWPTDTSGHAARAWRISKSTAANVLKGHASDETISHILREGGWAVALAISAAVIGQPLEDFINQQAEAARRERDQWEARQAELDRLAAHVRRGRPEPDRVAG